MLHNRDGKIDNKNRMQTEEISRKNNLNINCPSFIPKNLKKSNNSNDNSDDKYKIGLNEFINYFSIPSCSQVYKFNEKDQINNPRNILLNINAKEYTPIKKRPNEDSEKIEKIEYIEPIQNNIEENKKKRENSHKNDYFYLENPKKNNIKSYSDYSYSSKNSSSTNINVSIESWTKNDNPKEHRESEVNKKKLENSNNIDLIKNILNELLNKLKKNNRQNEENITIQIFEIIENKDDYQIIFIEAFFYKVCMESFYVELYAKLFKNLDKKLSQKYKVKGEGKRISSKFRIKLIEKCQKVFKGENYEKYIKEEEPNQRKNKLKKFIIGNTHFMTELIKIKMLSKKIALDCTIFLFSKYKGEKDKVLKTAYIVAIIIFIEKFEAIIHSEDKKLKEDEIQSYMKSINEMLKELELIKKDEEKHIQYMIEKLINKYKLEKNILVKSNKEFEEENINKDNLDKNLTDNKEEEINQEYINEKIKSDLINYKDFVEKNGNSESYPWNITTYLYDIKQQNFDDIIEGYIIACNYLIEKENNIKFTKDYIKELVEFYHDKINIEEKNQLQNKIFYLFEKVNYFTPKNYKIYNIYSYIIYIFIINEIMDIKSLENIIKDTKMINKENLIAISIIYNNIYKYIKNDIFKNTLKKFVFIDRNKSLFKWVYQNDLESEIDKNY
jgi:hypothetical protein